MKINLLKYLLLTMLAVGPLGARASDDGVLTKLDLTNIEKQASERVTVTLDKSMLEFAAGFLPKEGSDTKKLQNLITNLDGIYVRDFSFDGGKAYSQSDVEAIRKQLPASWSKMVEVRGKENVDFYVMRDGDKFKGFFLIDAEPSELALVNIQGSIRPEQLSELQGFAGIPNGIFKQEKDKRKDKDPAPKNNDDGKK